MKFRTELTPPNFGFNITHQSKILAIGSCFTEHIGARLKQLKHNIQINPFGILFNPQSIAQLLQHSLHQISPDQTHFIASNQLVYSLDFHSKFNAESLSSFQSLISAKQQQINTYLASGNVLMLTFGTAWVYTYNKSGKIIANCLKLPANQFTKHLLNLNTITESYKELFNEIFVTNPQLKIILTVSPVRHIKDGLVENNRSKSLLLLLCQNLEALFPKNVFYYPSYEIVMDDLRDYRFYNEDLIHPNHQAISYIFEKFSQSFFTESVSLIHKKVEQLNKLKQHRFLNASADQIQKHHQKIEDLERDIEQLIE
jgi:hypothetical protein